MLVKSMYGCSALINFFFVIMSASQYDSSKKYLAVWERDFLWVQQENVETEDTFCKLCREAIQPKITSLEQHTEEKAHVNMSMPKNITPPHYSKIKHVLCHKRPKNYLAMSMACHCTIRQSTICEILTSTY